MGRYEEAYERTLKNLERSLALLELETVVDTDRVQCFRMALPGTRVNCVQITCTPEGIAIQGDVCVGHNGVCSTFGYGPGWLGGRLDGDYLCEKFLAREFVGEGAQDHLQELLDGDDPPLTEDQRTRALEFLGFMEHSAAGVMMDYGSFCCSMDLEPGGYAYDPAEKAVLVAIQRRFAALYTQSQSAVCEAPSV